MRVAVNRLTQSIGIITLSIVATASVPVAASAQSLAPAASHGAMPDLRGADRKGIGTSGSDMFALPPESYDAPSAADPARGWLVPALRSSGPAVSDNPYAYQWRGLIWQSVEFDVVELTFRSTSDNVLRDLVIHKPFWHDWLASMQQWNMRRFSDGDDFLVDDVGHPIQGAVSAFIEIQNSPTDSRIEWNEDGYWNSRFKAFLWATAFSTQQKVSPVGEAGIGNDGGFTYGNQCLYHCNAANFPPGSKYTNNTGWTDLVITPTVGTLWVFAEDFLDKDVSDRLSAKYPDKMWPKFVRGGLNPSRSFANMLRWRVPWYRDFQEPIPAGNRVHFFSSDDVIESHELARVEFAPYFAAPTVAANTASCFNCREFAIGAGLQTTTRIRGWLTFDSDVSYHPDASPLPSDRAGGSMTRAVFGLGASRNWRYWGLHVGLRPGVVHFDNAYLTSPQPVVVTTTPPGIGTLGADPASHMGPGVVDANGQPDEPQLGGISHFDWNVNVAADYRISPRFGIRFGINDDIVRYRTDKVDAPGIGAPPYLRWLSKENFINRGNVGYQLGPVFSF